MPNAMTIQKINTTLTTDAVVDLARDPVFVEQVSRPGAFLEVAQQLLSLTADELEYLQSIPSVLQEAIRAGVANAIVQGKAIQVQYSPAYDFAVQLWDFGQAVSIHLSGPYPPSYSRTE